MLNQQLFVIFSHQIEINQDYIHNIINNNHHFNLNSVY
jgi:hypothetical protein